MIFQHDINASYFDSSPQLKASVDKNNTILSKLYSGFNKTALIYMNFSVMICLIFALLDTILLSTISISDLVIFFFALGTQIFLIDHFIKGTFPCAKHHLLICVFLSFFFQGQFYSYKLTNKLQ
jgi:hypothetical protein